MFKKFGFLLGLIPLFGLVVAEAQQPVVVLADFSTECIDGWKTLSDSVRDGGSSTANLSLVNGVASFSGNLNLIEGRGFASIRKSGTWDLSSFENFMAEVKGDGRIYTILLKDERATLSDEAYNYEAKILPPQFDSVVTVNKSEFKAVVRGQYDETKPPIDWSKVREFGIQINDRIVGNYLLNMRSFWFERGQ